jgi:hypothetical protein
VRATVAAPVQARTSAKVPPEPSAVRASDLSRRSVRHVCAADEDSFEAIAVTRLPGLQLMRVDYVDRATGVKNWTHMGADNMHQLDVTAGGTFCVIRGPQRLETDAR